MTTPSCNEDKPTPDQLYDARGWLLDCGFSDELIFDLTDVQIVRFVDLEYEGGWSVFRADCTGRLVNRQIAVQRPSTRSDALAHWTVMLAKAHALGQLRPDDNPAPVNVRAEL